MRPEVGRQLGPKNLVPVLKMHCVAHTWCLSLPVWAVVQVPVLHQLSQKSRKEQGALTVAVVSKPFSYEGKKCMDIADEGLEALSNMSIL